MSTKASIEDFDRLQDAVFSVEHVSNVFMENIRKKSTDGVLVSNSLNPITGSTNPYG